jgi:hypothetical protein
VPTSSSQTEKSCGNLPQSNRQSLLLQPGNLTPSTRQSYSFSQTILTPSVRQSRQFLLLRSGNLYSQKHTARHRYLYTTNQPISVHNSSMNITKTPIGSRAAWRQLAANSIKMRPAGTTDTVATKLATRPRQIYLLVITDQKQQLCYYSDHRPARLYQTSVPLSPHRPTTRSLPAEASQWPPGKILTKPLPQLTHSPLAARIVYRQYSSHCRHASLQPPELSHIWTALFRVPQILNRADNGQAVVTSVSGCLKCYDIPQSFSFLIVHITCMFQYMEFVP